MDLLSLIDRRVKLLLQNTAQSQAGQIDHNALRNLAVGHPHTQYPRDSGADVVGVVLSLSADTSIPTAAWTSVNWGVENLDTDNFHAGTNAYITIPYSGLYLVLVLACWAVNALGIRDIGLGAFYNAVPAVSGTYTAHNLVVVNYYSAGATLTPTFYQNTGAALNLIAAGTRFAAFLVK